MMLAASLSSGWFLENAFLIPLIPAIGFAVIIGFGRRLPKGGSEVGIASMALSLVIAIVVRVFGPGLLPGSYAAIIMVAGGLWVLTFALFTIVYAPILVRSRADGKSG